MQQAAEGDLDAMVAIIKSAKDHLVLLRPGQPIGLIGFSMGTDWAVMTAAKAQDVAATVLFYGGFTTDFSQMKSSVLGHYAEKDEWVPFEQAINMEQAMKAADVDVTLYYYPGTAHWFMEEDRPEYDPAAASRVVGMPYWASHGVRHRLWETISQRELQVTCYARCHRSGLLASRITTLLASRSSWTHFIHFANEINHHIPVTHSWQ